MENENTPVEYKIFEYEDGNYKTLLTKKFQNRKPYAPADPRLVYGFIPGTILKVFVKEKHRVKKGEPLLILQAMKMNNIITAPINGVIKKINVKTGETVPKSQILIEFR